MAPLAILTPMLLLSQSVLGFGLPGYSARETAYHNYRPGEGRYSPPPHHPRSSPPSMVADGVWDILKWQGYFLTQCLDTGSSDDDNDYDGGGCPRGGRFAEVAWYRNQSRSCVDSGDRRRPDCQRLGDVGWVGDRAGVRWEAEPGDLCLMFNGDRLPFCVQISWDAWRLPRGEYAGYGQVGVGGCGAVGLDCYRFDNRLLWTEGGKACYVEYFCEYQPPWKQSYPQRLQLQQKTSAKILEL